MNVSFFQVWAPNLNGLIVIWHYHTHRIYIYPTLLIMLKKNNENRNVSYLCYWLTECKVVLQSSYYWLDRQRECNFIVTGQHDRGDCEQGCIVKFCTYICEMILNLFFVNFVIFNTTCMQFVKVCNILTCVQFCKIMWIFICNKISL